MEWAECLDLAIHRRWALLYTPMVPLVRAKAKAVDWRGWRCEMGPASVTSHDTVEAERMRMVRSAVPTSSSSVSLAEGRVVSAVTASDMAVQYASTPIMSSPVTALCPPMRQRVGEREEGERRPVVTALTPSRMSAWKTSLLWCTS